MHPAAAALIVAKMIDFAAGLREQSGLAQLFVQVLGVERTARLGPLDVIAVCADLEFGSLLAQGGHVFDQKTEGGILVATLLGEVVVGQQPLPHALTNPVDRLQIDRAQAQALGQGGFIQRLAGQQDTGKHEDLGPGRHVEQCRVAEFLRPGAAIERRHIARSRDGAEAQ
ncbi:hypothetical protein D9M71_610780 [compost metagenome]